jgi:hypothetical protein
MPIDLRSKYYVKPKADHPGLRAERKVISKLSLEVTQKKPDPDKKIETKIDSVECISIHRVDS